MPFYEYECSACKFYVEVLQKLSDAPLKKCPSCKKPALKKLVSAPVFRLKGSGWYETDFKSDQDKKRNLVGDDKDTSSDTSSDSKSDSKADGKTDNKAESKAESTKEKSSDSKSSSEKSASEKSASKSASKGGKAAAKKPTASSKAKSKPAAKKK